MLACLRCRGQAQRLRARPTRELSDAFVRRRPMLPGALVVQGTHAVRIWIARGTRPCA